MNEEERAEKTKKTITCPAEKNEKNQEQTQIRIPPLNACLPPPFLVFPIRHEPPPYTVKQSEIPHPALTTPS